MTPHAGKRPTDKGVEGSSRGGEAVEAEGGQVCRVEAIVMSAGEMESDRAGAPGFLIRQRYRQAAQRARARGRLTCLLINDIDAGRSTECPPPSPPFFNSSYPL